MREMFTLIDLPDVLAVVTVLNEPDAYSSTVGL
jgi:hypothetical protein